MNESRVNRKKTAISLHATGAASCHVWMSHGAHMNESCLTLICHVTYKWLMLYVHKSWVIRKKTVISLRNRYWVMSRMNESWQVWMSHVTYEWVMPRTNGSCHIWMSHVTYLWVMTRMHESCHVWMSHDTNECVMSRKNESWHIWMSHVTYKWVMTRMNESCHTSMSHAVSRVAHKWDLTLKTIHPKPQMLRTLLRKGCAFKNEDACK